MAKIELNINGAEGLAELLNKCQEISETDDVILNGLDNVDTQTAITILKALPENLRSLDLEVFDGQVNKDLSEKLGFKIYESRSFADIKIIFANLPRGLQALRLQKGSLFDANILIADNLTPEERKQYFKDSSRQLLDLFPESLKVLDVCMIDNSSEVEATISSVLIDLIKDKKFKALRGLRMSSSGSLPKVTALIRNLEERFKGSDVPSQKLTLHLAASLFVVPRGIGKKERELENFQKAVAESVHVQFKLETPEHLKTIFHGEGPAIIEMKKYLALIEEHIKTAKVTQQIALLEELPAEMKREILMQYNDQNPRNPSTVDPEGPKIDPSTLDALDKLKKFPPKNK